MPDISSKRGVYFSANDAVYDWTVAFLNSYRRFNPDLPLFLIPFNEECKRLRCLQSEYDFRIYTHPTFSQLEAIGEAFELGHTPTGPYWFRRYASFWGPLDEFMYLDARQLVLTNLEPYVKAPREHGFDLLHYDCALNQVYRPGPLRRKMVRQHQARGFNAGRWASRQGLFSMKEFEKIAEDALEVRNQLHHRNTDQAFFNYCCDTQPVNYGHFAEVLGDICQQGWANQPGHVYEEDNTYRLWNCGGLDHTEQVILIHWAGISNRRIIPERRWYLKYRYLRSSQITYLLASIIMFVVSLPDVLLRKIRQQRHINQLYHHFFRRDS